MSPTDEQRLANQQTVNQIRAAEDRFRDRGITEVTLDFEDVRPALLSYDELTEPGQAAEEEHEDVVPTWHPWLEHGAEILLAVIFLLIIINVGRIFSSG